MNKDKIIVSVCVQTYQHVNYIKQCLDGILMQKTDFSYEIILGEDESDDGTRDICKDYAKKHPDKIKLFLRTRKDVIYIGGKPTGRFNMIENLKACKGKYIALCEGDDYWTDPLKLQKQVGFLESHENYVACFHPCSLLRMRDNPSEPKKQSLSDIKYKYTVKNLLSFWNIPTAALLIRNDFNLPHWFNKVASGDIALVMLNYEKGKFKLLEDYMSVYRLTGEGVSESHKGYRMVHYRAVLYTYLNEHFNFKYEEEIYKALLFINNKFTTPDINNKKNQNLLDKIISKLLRR